MPNTKFINDAIYGLEREYGCNILLVDIEHLGANLQTGTLAVQKRTTTVKVVVLPQNLARKFFYDVGYLRANSNFTYGGLDDIKTLTVLVRKVRLPRNFVPDLNREILYNRKRYDKVSVDEFVGGSAFVFTAKEVEGALTYQQFHVQGSDTVPISELGTN